MLSKFKNLFKRSDLDEKNAFRNRVLEILRRKFPEIEFSAGQEMETIDYSGKTSDEAGTLGLTNIYATFLLTAQTKFELAELVDGTFGGLMDVLKSIDAKSDRDSWETVRSIVLPQLMPIEYSLQFEAINLPFAENEEVLIGFVIDGEASYSYVTQEIAAKWNVPVEEIYEQALDNLSERSSDLEMTFVPEPNRMLVIATMDGFDATRILVPHLREFMREKLGERIHFGVPNRDFLICWSADSEPGFCDQLRRQVADDFEERPYSLSGAVFELDRDDLISRAL